MTETEGETVGSVALVLLGALAVVAVGTLALSGPVASQSGASVDVEDTILADQASFDVTVGPTSSSKCVAIRKNGDIQDDATFMTSGDETVSVDRSAVGGYEHGDDITAEVHPVRTFVAAGCGSGPEDSDTTTVTATGSLDIQEPILADETSFSVRIEELHTSRGQGCVVVDNVDNDDGSISFGDLGEGAEVSVTEDDVGRWQGGDEILVLLYDDTCDVVELDRETTAVEARGRVELEERIFADQTRFQVTVSRLIIDGSSGCVVVDNGGGGDLRMTDFDEGETRNVTEDDVGTFRRGDEIVATLFSGRTCGGDVIDTDTKIVAPARTPTPTATPAGTATATATGTPTATEGPTATATGDSGSTGDGLPPRFEVRIDEARLPAGEGEPLEVDVTVENTGDARDTQTVRLSVDGEERDVSQLTLDGGESRSVQFSWDDPTDAEQHDIEVASNDDTDDTLAQVGGESGEGGFPGGSGGILLLLLLVLVLLGYYYVRRRRSGRDRVYATEEEE